MFSFNPYGDLQPLSIFLVNVEGDILCNLDPIIDHEDAALHIGVNQQSNLTFSVTKGIGDGSWFDFLQEGMYLFVEKVGLFKMNQPEIVLDGTKETKEITAYSIDSELEDKTCKLPINMGLKTSQEYLVTYDSSEKEPLINPYTGIPFDWIVLYNTFPEQLQDFLNELNSGVYGTIPSSGSIEVTDSALMKKIESLISTIPRLKCKIRIGPNASSVTSTDFITPIWSETQGGDRIITGYTIYSDIETRVNELIVFYGKYREQLSLLSLVLENTGGGWTVGDIYGVDSGDYTLANMKGQFDINETIYSFLTQKLAQSLNCVIDFDTLNRKVNVVPLEHLGEDTGISIEYDTLVNSLNITTDEERLATRLLVSGGNNLDIARVNFGSNYVDDLSYKLNTLAKTTSRTEEVARPVYISQELADKYTNYIAYRESQRGEYIRLSKRYEKIQGQIYDIENRVPNFDLKTDWGTFTMEELETALTNFTSLLTTLKALYKEDYSPDGVNSNGTIKESYIQNTEYWWDYTAYKEIIKEIECAIDVFPYYSDPTKWTTQQKDTYDNPSATETYIKAWETKWSLYGVYELQAKIAAYKQNMDILAEEAVIRTSAGADTIKTWNDLTTSEKSRYGDQESNYRYSTYMGYYNNYNNANNYLTTLTNRVNTLRTSLEDVQEQRLDILENVSYDNNFTEEEKIILYRLFRDATYTNENILSTSIDTPSEKIDHMVELLNDAKEQASITSRPQLTFSVDANNLLGIPEFSDLWGSFVPGNYILVEYRDHTYVKLRMTGFSFNPCLPSSEVLQIDFSNYIRSNSNYKDWASILGNGSGGSVSSFSSGGGSGGSGAFGESSDIDVTISNTMLSKLLNTELFGTRVADAALDSLKAKTINSSVITSDKIVSGAISTDHIAASGISADKITSGTIDASVIDVTNLDANNITSGSIDAQTVGVTNINADNITSGTLSAARIGANTISANKIIAGDITNYATVNEYDDGSMVPDTDEYGLGTKTIIANSNSGLKAVVKNNVSYTYLPLSQLRCPNRFVSGDELYYEIWLRAETTPRNVTIRVNAYDSKNPNNSYMGGASSSVIAITTTATKYTGTIKLQDSDITKTYTEGGTTHSMTWSNAAYYMIGVRDTSTSDNLRAFRIIVRKKANAELIVDGAITTDKLNANAVTADKIAAGAVTANKIAANAITADKITGNAIDGKNFTGGIYSTKAGKSQLLTVKLTGDQSITNNGASSTDDSYSELSARRLVSKSASNDAVRAQILPATLTYTGTGSNSTGYGWYVTPTLVVNDNIYVVRNGISPGPVVTYQELQDTLGSYDSVIFDPDSSTSVQGLMRNLYFTDTTPSTGITGISAYKRNGIVMLRFSAFSFSSGSSEFTESYRLPSGLRPVMVCDFISTNNQVRFRIDTDGYIQPTSTLGASTSIRGTYTYLVALNNN